MGTTQTETKARNTDWAVEPPTLPDALRGMSMAQLQEALAALPALTSKGRTNLEMVSL